ncbi:lyase family protein [Paralimibaculum aggregatum]|uniref:Lyase family protein n=1 Tax=Paralimibaculum aggregatum TaxID=3036245 RepID=A0ABQ6LKZ8_9RHOB|nr:lyase family protein [Limibaculum sp. NKW23]GMG83096.1 lyase family protein [Limibaculum sp. NKW23]
MSTSLSDSPVYAGLFGDPEIAAHLTPQAEIAAMIRYEAALAEVEARLGLIPAAAGPAIAAALDGLTVAPEELAAGTRSAGVPVPALVARLRAAAGPHGSHVHWGATSQDVLDGALLLRLRPVLEILERRLRRLTLALLAAAEAHATLAMAGRTRSQIAAPTTLGLRIAAWAAPLGRCLDRLAELRPRLLVVPFGGAVGNLSVLGEAGPAAMDALADALGLAPAAKPWGTERDGVVELANWLAMVSGLLARIGADLMLMGRSEIGEMTAGEGGGSSTMPQKANPVLAETLVALGRQNAGAAATMAGALLHTEERDAAAWSLEWPVLPQMLLATGAGLLHAGDLAGSLAPRPARMAAMLEAGGGAARAEALAFALAREMPLGEAQGLLKQAARALAAEGGRLADHLAPLCAARGVAVPEVDDAPMLANAAAFIARLRAAFAHLTEPGSA